MRKLIFPLLIAILFSCCNQHQQTGYTIAKDTFELSGSLAGLNNDTVYFTHRTGNSTVGDTVVARNDSFYFTGKCPQALIYRLQWYKQGKKVSREIFMENALIRVEGNVNKPEEITVSGSAPQKDYDAYIDLVKPLSARMDSLGDDIEALQGQKKENEALVLIDIYDSLQEAKARKTVAWISRHKNSAVSPLIALRTLASDSIIISRLDSVYQMIDSTVQRGDYGKQLGEMVTSLKQTQIGSAAPAFTLNDTTGRPVSLASFKGKIVLVDFWASWCGPCRHENPNVVKAYKKYHAKGFEILGVSLDDKHDKWTAAIQKDNLAWQQVSDLKGWNNAAAKQYAINSIPNNFLLDKNGIIIAKGLRGDMLEKKLEEVLQ